MDFSTDFSSVLFLSGRVLKFKLFKSIFPTTLTPPVPVISCTGKRSTIGFCSITGIFSTTGFCSTITSLAGGGGELLPVFLINISSGSKSGCTGFSVSGLSMVWFASSRRILPIIIFLASSLRFLSPWYSFKSASYISSESFVVGRASILKPFPFKNSAIVLIPIFSSLAALIIFMLLSSDINFVPS